jgi:hypothetical protein
MSHTPGPWEVSNSTDVFTRTGARNAAGIDAAHNDGWQICDCSVGFTFMADGGEAGLDFAEQMANARLIAAAPDLLEAAEAFIEAGTAGNRIPYVEPSWNDVWRLMRAAIAKARGAS